MHEPPGRYDVIIRVARDGGQLPDPVTFAVAADQAASRRSASIISVHMAGAIINVVTVTAPGRYAALAVARAVVSDALKLQTPSSVQLDSDARCRGAVSVLFGAVWKRPGLSSPMPSSTNVPSISGTVTTVACMSRAFAVKR